MLLFQFTKLLRLTKPIKKKKQYILYYIKTKEHYNNLMFNIITKGDLLKSNTGTEI